MKRMELIHSKKSVFAGLLILALTLAACGTASPTQESSPAGASDTPAIATAVRHPLRSLQRRQNQNRRKPQASRQSQRKLPALCQPLAKST